MKHLQFYVKKSTLILLVLLSLTLSMTAQESERNNQIYKENKDSVFFVSRSVLIDESRIKHIELFQKLEEAMDVELLNQYIPIASGSAFLVNSDGYFVTAAHVLQYKEKNDAIDSAKWVFQQHIAKQCIPGYLSKKELSQVFKDFVNVIKDSDFVITIKSVDQVDYVAERINENQSDDLALLKIDLDREISPVIFDIDKPISVGHKVFTIGFPLQFVMDTFLDDFKPTLTEGVISAIRSDKWDLQHTASINAGNSGGPLFGEDGKLIGINLGSITNANDIYFSTNSSKIQDWLVEIDMADLISVEEIE